MPRVAWPRPTSGPGTGTTLAMRGRSADCSHPGRVRPRSEPMAERATGPMARRGRAGFLAGLGWLAAGPVVAGVFTLGALLLDQNEGLIPLLDLQRELGEMNAQVQELE